MLNLLRLLSGYLVVCFFGENSERMLNLCAKHSIKLWNLRFNKGKIIGNVRIKDFYLLRKIRPKKEVKIHIISRHGLVFKTYKYKKRIGFITGFIIFVLLLELLSSFIWSIKVEGNINIEDMEIISACDNIGIKVGTKIKDIDTLKSAQKLLINHKSLAWASLNIEGSKLTVNISEIKNPKEETELPSNLIADFDGEIRRIDVTSGNTLVKIGDTVRKGDVLVSGIIENQSSTCFVNSRGNIEAITKREFTVNGNYIEKKHIYNGKLQKRRVLELFSVKLPLYLGKENQRYKSEFKIKKAKFLSEELPITLYTKTLKFTDAKKIVFSENELLELLKKQLKNKIKKSNLDIIKTGEIKINYNSKGITLSQEVICSENIAIKQPILINSIN